MASASSNATVDRRPKFVVIEVETESNLPSLVKHLLKNGIYKFGRDEEFIGNNFSSSSSPIVFNRRPKFVIKIEAEMESKLPDLVDYLLKNGFNKFTCGDDLNDMSLFGNDTVPTNQSSASVRNPELAATTTTTTTNGILAEEKPKVDDRNGGASALVENDGTEANVKKERSEMTKKSGDDGNSGMKKSGSASMGPKLEPNDHSDGSGNGIEKSRVETKKQQGETTKPLGKNEPGTVTAASNGMSTEEKPQLANQIGASAMVDNGTKAIVKKESGNASVSQNQSSVVDLTLDSDEEGSADGDGSSEKSTQGQQRRQRARDRNRSSASGRNPVLAPTTATSNGTSTRGEKPKANDRNGASAMVENDGTEANVKKEPSEMKKWGNDDNREKGAAPKAGESGPKREPSDGLERSAIGGNLEPKKEKPADTSERTEQNESASARNPELSTAPASNGILAGEKPKLDDQKGATASVASSVKEKRLEMNEQSGSGETKEPSTAPKGGESTIPKRKPDEEVERSASGENSESKKAEPGDTSKRTDLNEAATATTTSSGKLIGKKRKSDDQGGASASAAGGSGANDKKRRSERIAKLDTARQSQQRLSALDTIDVESDEESLDGEESKSSEQSTQGGRLQRHERVLDLYKKHLKVEGEMQCRPCSKPISVGHSKDRGRVNPYSALAHIYMHLERPIFKCKTCSLTFTYQNAAYRHAIAVHEGRCKNVIDDETDKFHDEIMNLLLECFDEELG